MGRIILVIGGAGSGKSEYAEKICEEISGNQKKIYLATMKNDGSKSYEERVKRHRKLREGRGFNTIEKEADVSEIPSSDNGTVLLEDLTNLLSNIMFAGENNKSSKYANGSDASRQVDEKYAGIVQVDRLHDQNFAFEIFSDILALSYKANNIVIVMNDVFRDGMCYDNSTEKFLEELGELHKMLAEKADKIVNVIYGIPVILKEN